MREFLAPVDRVQADKDSVGGGICRTNDKRKDGRKKGQAEKVGETNCTTQKASAHKDRPQNKKQFAAEIAEVTGVTKREVNKKIARASLASNYNHEDRRCTTTTITRLAAQLISRTLRRA